MAEITVPPEIVEQIKSASSPGGAVKTLTDLKLESFEKRLAELEKVNTELRQANAELYAFAQAQQQAQPAQQAQTQRTTAQPVPYTQPTGQSVVSAQYVIPAEETARIQAMKAQEEANLQAVLQELGRHNAASSENKDGM